jgi:glycosyltransferase involved in cell wall biosynthesis
VPANRTRRVLLHAPSIHTGGGLELLKGLFSACSSSFDVLLLDQRIQGRFVLPKGVDVHWVKKSVAARLYAEWQLFRQCSSDDTVLCFHGLPPLFPLRGRVAVFVQNRILLESGSLAAYPLLTRIRLFIERIWLRRMRRHGNRYFVQTTSMAVAVRKCLGLDVEIVEHAFVPLANMVLPENNSIPAAKRTDFLYVSSGEAHKNHANLLEAWRLLAEAGLKPLLTLTVDPDTYPFLASEIARYVRQFGLNIVNDGHVPKDHIQSLYLSSTALIFASSLESFGLPLIEATQLGLPVLAPELDYVRDVIQPAETFDPSSPLSISRAVRRFLRQPEPAARIGSAEEFLAEVLR